MAPPDGRAWVRDNEQRGAVLDTMKPQDFTRLLGIGGSLLLSGLTERFSA